MKLTINGKEYRVSFTYNCFCDSDIFDRVKEMLVIMSPERTDDPNANPLARVHDLFKTTRDLLFIGFKRYNPVESPEEIGDLLDQYHEEAPEGEDRGILSLFLALTEELMNEGFLSDMMAQPTQPNRAQRRENGKK